MSQVSLVPILLWVAALACAGAAMWREPRPFRADSSSTGCCAICSCSRWACRVFGPLSAMCSSPSKRRRRSAGPTTPFQYEVGVANLGLGLACIYAAFKGFEARLAAGIVAACFLIGAGIGPHRRHRQHRAISRRAMPGRSWSPIFSPPSSSSRCSCSRARNRKPKSPATLALEAELDVARKALRDYRMRQRSASEARDFSGK